MDSKTVNSHGHASKVLEKIERVRQARRHKFYLRDEHITLSHGSGGKATHNLIEGVFGPAFSNPLLDHMDDAAIFAVGNGTQRLAFTTDSYVVSPLSGWVSCGLLQHWGRTSCSQGIRSC
jgi:hydrogenase expression/formation protein HypE